MIRTLNAQERRVLGVLIEKSLTQPDAYPMTLNSIQAGCNQKSNRDPVMDMNDDAVWHTLNDLRQQGLVGRVLPGPGGRTDRFKHEALPHYGWGKRQQAIMAELLLRGPQTAPELKTRCARMAEFEDASAVITCLTALEAAETSFVGVMPRQAGQRETRFAHRLYPPNEQPALAGQKVAEAAAERGGATEVHRAAGAADGAGPAAMNGVSNNPPPWQGGVGGGSEGTTCEPRSHTPRDADGRPNRADSAGVAELRQEIENLHAELADIHAAMADLRRRVEAVERGYS